MRITLVSPYDPDPVEVQAGQAVVGGVERVFAEVSRNLAQRGHDVTMLCSTDGAADRRHQRGVRMLRHPRRMTLLRAPVANLAALVPQASDVVHVAATYPFTTPAVLRKAKRMGVPSVLDFHFEPRPPGVLGRLAANVYGQLGPRAYPLADAVLVRSLDYARSATSLRAVPETRWRVVPNGIDPQVFRPGHRTEGEYILFVGRLVPYKGLEVLLHAMARNPAGLPLVVAGDGPLRASLESLASRLGVKARFLGRVADEALPDLYRNARVTVLPSVNGQEAFGIALVESMACGTPVVASNLPGVASVAREGGLVFPIGDVAALAAQLRNATEPGRLLRGEPLASKIHRLYSWDAVTNSILGVYEDLARGLPAVEAVPRTSPIGDPACASSL